MRDSQRSKLYDAERCLQRFDTMTGSVELDAVAAFYDKVTRTKFFRSLWQEMTGREIPKGAILFRLAGGRGARGGFLGYVRDPDPPCPTCGAKRFTVRPRVFVKAPHWARKDHLLLHELAHCVTLAMRTEIASHGREFVRVYLRLVRRFVGEDAHTALRDEFRKRGVRWYPRREKRALTEEQRGVLRDRLALARHIRESKRDAEANPISGIRISLA